MKDEKHFEVGDMIDVRYTIQDMDFHKRGEVVKVMYHVAYSLKVHDPASPTGFSIEYLPFNYKEYQ